MPGGDATQADEQAAAADFWDDDEWPGPDTGDHPGTAASARESERDDPVRHPALPESDEPFPPESDESFASNPVPAHRSFGVRRIGRHWGRFAELWVPESLRDARVDPGRRGALVLLLVAALAAVVTAVGVWRDRPEPRAVQTSAIAALAGEPVATASASAAAAAASDGQQSSTPTAAGSVSAGAAPVTTDIVVSVTGLVGHPGVVTLPAGSRVADAIAAAGGAGSDADLTGMNLAARLADGDSVVVASAAPGGVASGVTAGGSKPGGTADNAAAASGLVDLNTADEAALDTLPGVGPVMAQNILAWRESNGRFTSVEQLQEITGIGPSRYAQISPLVTVS